VNIHFLKEAGFLFFGNTQFSSARRMRSPRETGMDAGGVFPENKKPASFKQLIHFPKTKRPARNIPTGLFQFILKAIIAGCLYEVLNSSCRN
jgi:hypothetical protein